MLPAWQVCCVVCCTEVEGWGVETVTGGRAGRELQIQPYGVLGTVGRVFSLRNR